MKIGFGACIYEGLEICRTYSKIKKGGAKFRFVGDTEEKERNSGHYKKLYELRQYLRLQHVILTLGFVKVTRGYDKRQSRNPAFYFKSTNSLLLIFSRQMK